MCWLRYQRVWLLRITIVAINIDRGRTVGICCFFFPLRKTMRSTRFRDFECLTSIPWRLVTRLLVGHKQFRTLRLIDHIPLDLIPIFFLIYFPEYVCLLNVSIRFAGLDRKMYFRAVQIFFFLGNRKRPIRIRTHRQRPPP